MDTNPDNGVSLDDLAGMLDEPTQDDLPETEEEELSAELPEEEAVDEQSEPEAEADDLVEAEYEGKTYKVPKELKDALLRTSDYTRKTQEVAEMRRAAEERSQAIQAQEQFLTVTFDRAAELKQIQSQLSQFDQVDWQALSDSDPVQAQKLLIARQGLERQAALKQQELVQFQQQYQQLTEQQRQQRLVEAQKDLLKRLPDFNQTMAEKIKSTAKAYELTDNEIASVIDPRYVHILHDAMQWRELQAKKPQAMKKVVEAPKAVKPQASAPKPRNQAALQRLKSNGRVEDLAAFL